MNDIWYDRRQQHSSTDETTNDDDETNSNSMDPNEKTKSYPSILIHGSDGRKSVLTKIGTAPSSGKGWHGLCHDGQSVRWCKQGSRHCLLLSLLLRFTSLANQELSSTPQELPGVHPSLPTIAAVSISCKDLFAGVCARSFHRKLHHSCVKRS